MDLRAIVASAMLAVPTGLKGTVVFAHTSGRQYQRATDSYTGGATVTSTSTNAVVTTPTDDVALDGVEIDRQRRVTVAASELAFALDINDTATFGGHTWNVTKLLPTGPDGTSDVLYDALVTR